MNNEEEKLRKDKIQGAERATSVHYNVGKEVRNAIEKTGFINKQAKWIVNKKINLLILYAKIANLKHNR